MNATRAVVMNVLIEVSQPSVICVLGMHRSGSSLASRVLNLLGVYLGHENNLLRPAADNPTGFWEHRGVTELNDEILARLGGNWHEPPQFPAGWEMEPELADLRQRARTLVREHFSSVDLWGWKDPRTCLTLPFWKRLLPRLEFVINLRNPLDVARSLQKRDGFSFEKGMNLWFTHVKSALIHSAGLRREFFFYEDFINEGHLELSRLADFLGNSNLARQDGILKAFHEFVDEEMQHYSASTLDVSEEPALDFPAKALYLVLRLYVNLKRRQLVTPSGFDSAIETTLDSFSSFAATALTNVHALRNQVTELQSRMSELQDTLGQREQDLTCLATRDEKLVEEAGQIRDMIQVQQQVIAGNASQIEQLTTKRDQLIGNLIELKAVISSQQLTLKEKNEEARQLATGREKLIREVAGLELTVKSLGQALAAMQKEAEQLLIEREQSGRQILALEAEVRLQQEALAAKHGENEQFLAEHERLVQQTSQLSSIVQEQQSALRDRDRLIAVVRRATERLEKETLQLQSEYRQTQQYLAEERAANAVLRGQERATVEAWQRELHEKNVSLAWLGDLLQAREATLKHIYGSHGWKVLTAYYALRDKILPDGSKSRMALRHLWNLGWYMLCVPSKNDEKERDSATLRTETLQRLRHIASTAHIVWSYFETMGVGIWRKFPLREQHRIFLRDKLFQYCPFAFSHTESYRTWRERTQPAAALNKMVPALFYSRGKKCPVGGNTATQADIISYNARYRTALNRFLRPDYDSVPVDLSLVTYNSAKWIGPFFHSLLGQRYPLRSLRVFVTDHGSEDETEEILRVLQSKLRDQIGSFQVFKRFNRGFGSGHNFNFKQSNSPYFLVSNVDLEFEPDAITTAVATAEADDDKVASWEFRQKPYEHPKHYDPVTLETAWSSHACVLLRRTALAKAGGYDERIFMYGEDVELSYRLRQLGFKLKYCAKAVVWHFTYDYPEQVKPLQFSESVVSNAYIRLRYGRLFEVLAIPFMFGRLLVSKPSMQRQRLSILKSGLRIVMHGLHFLLARKRSETSFGFYEWDYDIRRDGAFYRYRPRTTGTCPLVSIIIRTYAGRHGWLRQAVASVLNQTYPNLELIVVEDGNNTAEVIMAELRQKVDLRIIYKSCEKRGRSHAGNVGLSLATGEYLCFLDDDDAFMADHVEVLVNELSVRPDLGAAYALSWEVETQVSQSPHFAYEDINCWTPSALRQPFSRAVMSHHNFIPIQAIVFRHSLYKRYGGLDESLAYLEDWNLWVRYSSEREFLFVEKTTSLFRVPHERKERERRHLILHENYAYALEKNAIALKKIAKSREEGSRRWELAESGTG
jgi:GT2 family glycosyltransferase